MGRKEPQRREKRKPATTFKQDRRPHLGMYMRYRGWVTWEELEPKPEERPPAAFYTPGKDKNPTTWSKQDAHSLIDMYAGVAWGIGSTTHREMSANVPLFIRLYERQEGRCAITGTRIYGGPGLKDGGIGIDLISRKRGIRKGNVRLVSMPLALTRYEVQPEPLYGAPLEQAAFDRYPISWALFKSLQWHLKEHNPFKHIPVIFRWAPPECANMLTTRAHSIEAKFVHITRHLMTYNSLHAGEMSHEMELFGRVVVDEERLILLDKQERYLALTEPVDLIEYLTEYFKSRFIKTYKEVFISR